MVALGDAGSLLAPFERQRIKAIADARLRGEAPPSLYEMQGVRKDGSRIWLQIHSRRVEWNGSAAIQSTVVDISALKQREAELNAAKELAEVASRTKTEFLANMSHELRTPLTAIIGFSEVLEAEMFGPHTNPSYKQYAADIRDSGAHLLEIINDILDVSKIEAGKVELREEAVAVDKLVEAALTLVRERAEEGGLTLVNKVEAGPLLMADPRLLKQILVNLLSNAVKFTPMGGKVTVDLGPADNNSFELRVADTGIGILPEDIETVMKPFRQADGTLSRSHEGTGLGLPLAKSLAQLHDGDIALASEPGIGTIASLLLPAKRIVELQAAE
jgi:signal transduction histidine kinase